MSRLSRRHFVVGGCVGFGLLTGCGRLPWQAQEPAKVPRVGFLGSSSPGGPMAPVRQAFIDGLRDLGYVEGQTIIIDWRFADGSDERLAQFAAELAGLPVDVIFAGDSRSIPTAKQATATVPIVFGVSGDPVGAGLVESLARPGGNVTGLSALNAPLAQKRLELLKGSAPAISRVAVLWNPTDAGTASQWRGTEAAAQTLGVQLQSLEVRGPGNLDGAFETAAQAGVDALIVLPDPITVRGMAPIVDWAARSRLPAMYPLRSFVEAGGLMVYGANPTDQFRRAASYVDRILKGTKPADLPVEQPMTFDFVVNTKTARELGITFPNEIMLQVTEVIDQ